MKKKVISYYHMQNKVIILKLCAFENFHIKVQRLTYSKLQF